MTLRHRNDTAHDYGEGFSETTLKLLPDRIADAKALAGVLETADDGCRAASLAEASKRNLWVAAQAEGVGVFWRVRLGGLRQG